MRAATLLALTIACAGNGPPAVSLSGWIDGVISAGVTVDLEGDEIRSTTTDSSGRFTFDRVPDGTYTVRAASPSWSFTPSHYDLTTRTTNVVGLHFLSTPPSSPFAVEIAGDAASGVVGGVYAGKNGSLPNPDVAVYDPANDVWTVYIRFDSNSLIGLGGPISFHGAPSASTYTETTSGLLNTPGLCWAAASGPGVDVDQYWMSTSFTLTFSSVGSGILTNVPGASGLYVTDYPVHGAFRSVCTPSSNSTATGTVTLDVRF